MKDNDLFSEISAIYSVRGAVAYFGEAVTTLEHSLQAAYFAHESKAPNALIVAALLHDIGHLIDSSSADIAEWTTDARHEVSGSGWLAAHFGPEVSEPVRLHVRAKRYLCAADPSYPGRLSSASMHTLTLQGGPMSHAEVTVFEAETYRRDAIVLRHWDDRSKVVGMRTPEFSDYRKQIEALIRA